MITLAGANDTGSGGDGNDFASYATATEAVRVQLNRDAREDGNLTDELQNFEGLIGSSFADTLIGNESANTLYGRDGADSLVTDGGIGCDLLDFGAGNDTFQWVAGVTSR